MKFDDFFSTAGAIDMAIVITAIIALVFSTYYNFQSDRKLDHIQIYAVKSDMYGKNEIIFMECEKQIMIEDMDLCFRIGYKKYNVTRKKIPRKKIEKMKNKYVVKL